MKSVGYYITDPYGETFISEYDNSALAQIMGYRSSPVYVLTDDEIAAITPFDLDCFTARQREMVKYIRAGLSNKLIAFEMGLSEATVKVHIRSMFARVKVNSRAELMAKIGKF